MLRYEKLAATLREEIAQGTYKKGERLPTTPELCRIYDVSNTTVKRAMDDLELEGLVARRRGSGVYVKQTEPAPTTKAHLQSTSQQLSGLTTELGEEQVRVESQVIDFSVVRPEAAVAEQLAMEPDEFAYQICRVRIAAGRPQVVEYTLMPIKVIPDLREATLHDSIYAYIEGELGLKIGSAHRTIKAVMPTPNERTWLQIGEGEPLLEVRQVAYLADGTPFESSISRHTSDYEFFSISTR